MLLELELQGCGGRARHRTNYLLKKLKNNPVRILKRDLSHPELPNGYTCLQIKSFIAILDWAFRLADNLVFVASVGQLVSITSREKDKKILADLERE